MAQPEDLPETGEAQSPSCDSYAIQPTGALIITAGNIRKVQHRCIACGERFWYLRGRTDSPTSN